MFLLGFGTGSSESSAWERRGNHSATQSVSCLLTCAHSLFMRSSAYRVRCEVHSPSPQHVVTDAVSIGRFNLEVDETVEKIRFKLSTLSNKFGLLVRWAHEATVIAVFTGFALERHVRRPAAPAGFQSAKS